MVVRQAVAEDPEMVPEAKMTLVVEGQLTGNAIEELQSLKSGTQHQNPEVTCPGSST